MEGPGPDPAALLEDRTQRPARGEIPQPRAPSCFWHAVRLAVAAEGRVPRPSLILQVTEECSQEPSRDGVPDPTLADWSGRSGTLSAGDEDRTVRVKSHPFNPAFER